MTTPANKPAVGPLALRPLSRVVGLALVLAVASALTAQSTGDGQEGEGASEAGASAAVDSLGAQSKTSSSVDIVIVSDGSTAADEDPGAAQGYPTDSPDQQGAEELLVETAESVPPNSKLQSFLTPSDTFSRKRFGLSASISGSAYALVSVGLYTAWYDDAITGGFRTIDDTREWEGMDKLGHSFTTYYYSSLAYQGLNWSGVPKRRRLLLSVATGMFLQSTVEVFDGFSADWGFSWADMGANALGATVFATQQLAFDEQRLYMKFSAGPQSYPTEPLPTITGEPDGVSAADRAAELFGTSRWTRFLKDYGGQTIWLSTNPKVLVGRGHQAKAPWLMLAVGYSPRNVLGAYDNTWAAGCCIYDAREAAPRARQFLLSVDVDLTKIPTRNRALKTLLFLANGLKVPAPAILLDSKSGLDWRWMYF